MSRGERWQCRTDFFVTYWRHSCIRNVSSTLQGGRLPGIEQVARMHMLRQEQEEEGGGHGRTVIKAVER